MKLLVAGAGAGKTTSMAEEVLSRYREVEDGKIIYVITYTNAARDQIRNKIIEQHGDIPRQVKVETSHVFLLQELVFPFYHLLYDQRYSSVSAINLPDNQGYRAKKLKELREGNIVHVQEVTNISSHVLYGKSNDKKLIKEKRKRIISIIGNYLDSIFIDEAQDIDKYLSKIIDVFHTNGFYLHLVGDPKQDLRARNEFRRLLGKYPQFVKYKKENHRCPISHVKLSNKYIIEQEKQEWQTEEVGVLKYFYENDINLDEFIKDGTWDYIYIYQKNERFITDTNDVNAHEDLLDYELKMLIKRTNAEDNHIDKITFILHRLIKKNLTTKNNWSIINKVGEILSLQLTKQDKARLYEALEANKEATKTEGIVVNSIDKVKGLEGNCCLFILTTELSEYFFLNKIELNKMMNYLYVALTRSKKELIILITTEVEEKYGREWINNKFKQLLK
ncbi:hypothetical protein CWR48_05025 [Oceanobacillus arenosus]|uniref:Uncharacterized protein n=1 Tax=Oceanobacillus arenosus TaxID=1229153 RepID=A0A3D8PXT6_9BACI|nr:UvrD-helicase domain-containing protein [Oceanobacillus arenosus]RDW20088.1 hypothetical protein CWR48_05025 [Oceanobacillus arenosus]